MEGGEGRGQEVSEEGKIDNLSTLSGDRGSFQDLGEPGGDRPPHDLPDTN